jgi:hypothetical protein
VTGSREDEVVGLAGAVSAARGEEHVTLAWEERGPAPASAEALARELGPFLAEADLRPVPAVRLRAIDREEAFAVLTHALAWDLAERRKWLPESNARPLVRRFLALFGPEALFFTNGTHEGDGSLRSCVPLGTTGLDTGVVALDHAQLALLWVEDPPKP